MTDRSGPRTEDPLRARPPETALAWLARQIGAGATIVSIGPLLGGQSHANHVVRLATSAGRRVDVVLRRWVRPDWRETDPQFSPEQEAATLELLSSTQVPAPRLIAVDAKGACCDVPAIVVTRAVGQPPKNPADVESFVSQLAEALPPIHAIDLDAASRIVPAYRPYYPRDQLSVPGWARLPRTWARAIEIATGAPPPHEPRFIHRDYHPGNTLWVRERLSAIVDWTTASLGSPSVDLSHMRANLAMSFDPGVADTFLAAHETVSGARIWHPYWDVRVAVDFLPDLPHGPSDDPRLSRLEAFVERAVARAT